MKASRFRRPATWIVLSAVVVSSCAPELQPDATLLIRNVDVVTMVSADILRDQDVQVGDGSIIAITPARRRWRTRSAEVVDGRGLTLLPGLVDMHVHARSEWALPLYLAHGVTTIRTMNGAFGDPLTWRAEADAGRRMAPRIVVAAPTIRFDGPPGYAFEATNSQRARRLVERAAEEGYDLVKVYQVPDSVLSTLMSAADSLGIPVAGHVPYYAEPEQGRGASRRGLEEVLASKLEIQHLGGLQYAWFGDDSTTAGVDELAQAVARAGVVVAPAASTELRYGRIAQLGEGAWTQSERAQVRRLAGQAGVDQLHEQVRGLHGTAPWNSTQTKALLRALYDANVVLLAGTDSHQASALAGVSLVDEIGLMIDVGVPPYEALKTATVNPASVLGRSADAGTVERGKTADLLLVEGNPLEDWTALRRVVGVVRGGAWLSRARLDGLVDEAVAHETHCTESWCEEQEGEP